MEEGVEIYPMPMFPTLAVRDVGASVGWYAEQVGFGTVFVMPGADGEPALGHLRWRKYADVLLVPDAAGVGFIRGVKGDGGVAFVPSGGTRALTRWRSGWRGLGWSWRKVR